MSDHDHQHDHAGHAGRADGPDPHVHRGVLGRALRDLRPDLVGQPNARLVEEVADLAPGTAVDVGCGEGADAVWLAGHGWTVTGVDVSGVALERAAEPRRRGRRGRAHSWQRADVFALDPLPTGVDLVAASYVHVPPDRFDGRLPPPGRVGGARRHARRAGPPPRRRPHRPAQQRALAPALHPRGRHRAARPRRGGTS